MSAEEAYQFYGDSIECIYYSTSGYKNVTLTPSSNRYVYYYASSTTSSENLFPSWVYSSSIPYVSYSAKVSDYSQNPSYLGFDISPNVHFSDCNAIRICAATYWGASGVEISSSAYSESFFNIFDGNTLRYTNSPYIKSDGVYSRLGLQRSGGSAFRTLPVPVDYTSDTLGDVSLLRIGFNGGRTDSGYITLYLSAPLVNDESTPEQGVVTGTVPPSSGGGDVNVTVNVDVDLSPLETALQNVGSDVQGIANDVSGIGSLLVVDSPETIAKLELDPIDTLPTLDYHKVIDDVDGVLEDIPASVAGTASIWGIIGSLFTSDSVWMWLVPFCVFMCLASFVLWRR